MEQNQKMVMGQRIQKIKENTKPDKLENRTVLTRGKTIWQ